jgi:presenilin 1
VNTRKKKTILSEAEVIGGGKNEQEIQRILCEKLGELSCAELEQLEETKACVHFDFYRNYIQIVSMFKPVLLICSLIFVYVHVICLPWQQKRPLVIWAILFYNPHPSDSTSMEVVGSLYNGLLVLAAVVGATMMYVVLLLLKQRDVLLRVLQVLNIVLLGGPTGYFIYQLLVVYSIRLDSVTFFGCVWNVVGVGWYALNYNGNSKTYLTRSFLILLAICMAWPFIEFPEPSVWATLGLLVVYDLFAVLAPCGPLRYIMEAEARLKREGREPKPLPGLVYRGHFFIVGLGDLVFYGALMGQASVPGWETALGCLIGILMGVAGTILWTTSSGKLATPALPMSAVLGLFLRLVVPYLVLPMCHDLSLHSLFL